MGHEALVLPGEEDDIAPIRSVVQVRLEVRGEDRASSVDRMTPAVDDGRVGKHAVDDAEQHEIAEHLVRETLCVPPERPQRRQIIVCKAPGRLRSGRKPPDVLVSAQRTLQNSCSPPAAISGWLDRICSIRVDPERGIPTIRIGVASSTPGSGWRSRYRRRRIDQPVDAVGERLALETAAKGAKAVAGLEILHRRFIISHVIMGLPQREMELLAMLGGTLDRPRAAFMRATSGPSSAVNFLLVARPNHRGSCPGKARQRVRSAPRPPRKTGLAKELAQKRMGFRALRVRLDPGAYRNERVVDCARSLERASLGDPSRTPSPWRPPRQRGTRRPIRRAAGAPDKFRHRRIWAATRSGLQRDRGPVALHRVRHLAQVIQDDRSNDAPSRGWGRAGGRP